MPFTLSHAAASLPFRWLKPVWPALVMGTFAPDLQYFILISDEDRSGHHFPDVLLITIPLALLMLWLFEWVVKEPAIELLPRGWQLRLEGKTRPLTFRGSRQFGKIVLWIAVGTLTHLLWDQFTHSYSRTAAFWPLLKTRIAVPLLHTMPLAGVLQDVSTIVGFLALCLWCAAWYRRTSPAPTTVATEFSPLTKLFVVSAMVSVAVSAGYALAYFTLAGHYGPVSRSTRAAILVMAMIQLFCVEMLIYGTVMTLRNRLHHVTVQQINEPGD